MSLTDQLDTEPTTENSIELLSQLNQQLVDASTGDELRDIYYSHHADVEDYIDNVCLTDDSTFDWETAFEITGPYQPVMKDCPIVPITANLISRGIVRTRLNQSVSEIPAEALRYIRSISWAVDGDFAGEYRGVYGWGIGHPTVDVDQYLKTRPMERDQIFMMGAVDHMFLADQEHALGILEHWCTGSYTNRFDDQEIIQPLYSLGAVVSATDGQEVIHGTNIGSWQFFEEVKRDFTLDPDIGHRVDEFSPLDYSVTDEYNSPMNRES